MFLQGCSQAWAKVIIAGVASLSLFGSIVNAGGSGLDETALQNSWSAGRFVEVVNLLQENPRPDSPNWNFNLGVAYLNTQSVAKAFAYLSRAARLDSMDPKIRAALSEARTRLLSSRDLQNPSQLDAGAYWYERLSDQTGLDEIRAIFGAIGLLFVILFVRQYRKTPRLRRSLSNATFAFLTLGLLLNLAIYLSQVALTPRPASVVLEPTSLRTGPSSGHSELMVVQAGTIVRVLGPSVGESGPSEVVDSVLQGGESSGPSFNPKGGAALAQRWTEVRVAHDRSGWIPAPVLLDL